MAEVTVRGILNTGPSSWKRMWRRHDRELLRELRLREFGMTPYREAIEAHAALRRKKRRLAVDAGRIRRAREALLEKTPLPFELIEMVQAYM